MPLLYATHPRYLDHDTGVGHPERPARLRAVEEGIAAAGLVEALVRVTPRPASRTDLERIHPPTYLDAIARFAANGGGHLDSDTHMGPGSLDAALLAAGAGLDLIERLDAGEGDAGFCAVRPPGHHATAARAMGFCLFNNVAVAAASLADRGERVLIVDYDAHHGNGTQDLFYDDARVMYVSMHESPAYPGTGRIDEVGAGDGRGTTINLPFPAGTTGDVYRLSLDDIVMPAAAAFGPTWLLISAGFDAHHRDPLCDLGLSAGDFADLTRLLVDLVPAGRRLIFLEGGYDLQGLADSVGAALSAVVDDGHYRPEAPTAGGPGARICQDALNIRTRLADE
ncbi:MAG: Histone deacetylase [Acidimicrobiales bacterium]|nr:Histone deacetylase [Acidimicrobiales bacterium]